MIGLSLIGARRRLMLVTTCCCDCSCPPPFTLYLLPFTFYLLAAAADWQQVLSGRTQQTAGALSTCLMICISFTIAATFAYCSLTSAGTATNGSRLAAVCCFARPELEPISSKSSSASSEPVVRHLLREPAIEPREWPVFSRTLARRAARQTGAETGSR